MTDFELALNILYGVIYEQKRSEKELGKLDKNVCISYISKLVYGVLENKLYLDYMIGKLSSTKLKKIHKKVLIILEIGFYNIRFLDKKDYAVVNNLVNLTKKVNPRSKNFVNAILRNFIRKYDKIIKIEEKDKLDKLSIRYSTPIYLVKYLESSYGDDFLEKFLPSINEVQDLAIRVNLKKTDPEALKNSLKAKGFILEESKISTRAMRVKNPAGLAKTSEFKEGLFTIQSEASIKAVDILMPRDDSKILDLCAAPGTKTCAIGEMVENSLIVANDLSSAKNHLIEENIKRLGLKNIKITNFDASCNISEFEGKFDYILVDAPCAGLGLMGRKPEIRYKRSMENIRQLQKLQREILDKAIGYLSKDGKLVYSTCSLGRLENLDNFLYLKGKKELKQIKIEGKDYLEFVNFKDGTDGFFICKFERSAI